MSSDATQQPGPFYRARVALAVAGLNYNQEKLIWDNDSPHLNRMLKPGDYEQLKGCGVEEVELSVPQYRLKHNHFVPQPGKTEKVILWEKKGDADKPHYLLFHGKNGHWGDSYSSSARATNTSQERECRLEFLKAIAERGEGFTAVTLRGYGKRNNGEPSKAAHDCDIAAVADYLSGQNIPFDKLKVMGTSLGTYAATEAQLELARRGHPEPELILVNPFSDMTPLATENANKNSIVKTLHVKLAQKIVHNPTLRHHMNLVENLEELGALNAHSRVRIFTSGDDEIIPAKHSDIIENCARANGLPVERRYFTGLKHCGIPDIALLEDHGLRERPHDWDAHWQETRASEAQGWQSRQATVPLRQNKGQGKSWQDETLNPLTPQHQVSL